ncbi:MAG: hypothetical protein AAFQ80_04420 [Cyanobacteria bacterium J06621_8]
MSLNDDLMMLSNIQAIAKMLSNYSSSVIEADRLINAAQFNTWIEYKLLNLRSSLKNLLLTAVKSDGS